MSDLNLLDCIAHGTTPAEFIRTFKSVNDAVDHLVDFYVENGGDASDEEIETAKTEAHEEFKVIAAKHYNETQKH